jgi:hypothetical protein
LSSGETKTLAGNQDGTGQPTSSPFPTNASMFDGKEQSLDVSQTNAELLKFFVVSFQTMMTQWKIYTPTFIR